MRWSRLFTPAVRVSAVALCSLVALSACKKTSGPGAAKEDLALAPKETAIALMANLTRMRNTAMWQRALDVRDSDPTSKKSYEDFVAQTGLDPAKHIDSAFIAFPQSGGEAKEFVAVLRGQFDEGKLVGWARDQAKKEGRELTVTEYGGKKIYTDSRNEAHVAFLDGKTVLVAGKEWVKKAIDLAGGKGDSAQKNDQLVALLKRVRAGDAMWGVGFVPDSTREQFKNDPRLASAATMKSVFGSVDFANGVNADINVDTATPNDAKELAGKGAAQLAETRKNPQFMMMGLGQYLDGIKIDSEGPTLKVALRYNQQQVDDLINRVKGLLRGFGNALGAPPVAPAPMSPPTP